MKESNPFFDRLITSIEPLPHNVYDYCKLDLIDIDMFGDRAALIIFNIDKNKRTRWIPFSQLRKDRNSEVYITKWLMDKIKVDDFNQQRQDHFDKR
jgi:hypothetical protein